MDIILGDCNINAFHENDKLGNVVFSYNQIVADSTHISGSLLDHAYIHKTFSKELSVQNAIHIYLSDHDAVKFRFFIMRITATLIRETIGRNFQEFYLRNLFANVSYVNFSCFHSSFKKRFDVHSVISIYFMPLIYDNSRTVS